jgi:transcription-repair coupling factor (superfamily II helicase)
MANIDHIEYRQTEMQFILDKIRALSQYQQLLKQIQAGGEFPGLGLPRAARLPILAALHQDLNQPILLVTDRSDHALSLFDELGFWVNSPRYLFAEPNPLFYEQAAWGVTTRRERLLTLTALSAYHLPFVEKPEVPPIIIASARSLMTRTMPRRDYLKACKKLSDAQNVKVRCASAKLGRDGLSTRQYGFGAGTIFQARWDSRCVAACGKTAHPFGFLRR